MIADKEVAEFLKELSELTRKRGIIVDGCGCCGSPFLAGENGIGTDLGYDEELKQYYVSGAEIEI